MEISKRLVLINSASSLLTRLLSISVLIWLQQYLLKRVSPEEYSLLPVVYSVMMFAPLITTVLTSGLGRFIVEAYATGDDRRITQIVSTMFPILCIAGVLFVAGGWTFAWHIDKILDIAPNRIWDARVMMALLIFSSAISLPLSPFTVGFFVRQKFVLQNLVGLGTEVLRLGMLFSLLFGVSTRILWVVAASVVAALVGQIACALISRQLVPGLRFKATGIHWPIARELTSFGSWNFLIALGDTIRMSSDPIILNKLATAQDVTCFHIGSLVQRQLHGIVGTLLAPVAPVLTAMYALGDMERLKRAYLRAGRISMLIGMLTVLPLIIFREPIIELYAGIQYIDASIVMGLLLGQSAFFWGNILYSPILQACGKIRILSVVCATMNIGNVILTIILVWQFKLGAVGSALATFCTATLLQIFLTPMAMNFLGIRVSTCWHEVWLPGLLPTLCSIPIWIFLRNAKYPDTWWSLGGEILSGAAVYIILAALVSIKKADWLDLKQLLSRKVRIKGQ